MTKSREDIPVQPTKRKGKSVFPEAVSWTSYYLFLAAATGVLSITEMALLQSATLCPRSIYCSSTSPSVAKHPIIYSNSSTSCLLLSKRKRDVVGGFRRNKSFAVVRSSLETVATVGQVTEVDKDTFWPIVNAAADKTIVLDMYTQWYASSNIYSYSLSIP